MSAAPNIAATLAAVIAVNSMNRPRVEPLYPEPLPLSVVWGGACVVVFSFLFFAWVFFWAIPVYVKYEKIGRWPQCASTVMAITGCLDNETK